MHTAACRARRPVHRLSARRPRLRRACVQVGEPQQEEEAAVPPVQEGAAAATVAVAINATMDLAPAPEGERCADLPPDSSLTCSEQVAAAGRGGCLGPAPRPAVASDNLALGDAGAGAGAQQLLTECTRPASSALCNGNCKVEPHA
jgi:hypothetical protein